MTEATDKIKDKIRKLLAKADNTACTVEEAKAFNDKAFELMAQYNLDRAMLKEKEDSILRTHMTLTVQVRPWSAAVLHALCKLYYCKWYYNRQGRSDIVTILGEEQNVAVTHALAVMILRAVQQQARVTGGGRSFMTGAGHEIYTRAEELILENKKTMDKVNAREQMNALVVVEDAGNEDYMRELTGGRIKKAKKSKPKVNNSAAYGAGREFGSSLPLRQGVLK